MPITPNDRYAKAFEMISRSRAALVIFLGSILLAGACWVACRFASLWTRETAPQSPEVIVGNGHELKRSNATTISNDFLLIHCKHFMISAELSLNFTAVRLRFTEFVPQNFAEASIPVAAGTTSGTHTAVLESAVSFFPRCYSSRGGNDLFLAGPPVIEDSADPDGGLGSGTVLERWAITAPLGGPYTIRTTSTAPIGTVAPLSSLSAQIPGGTYIQAEDRGPARLRKTMLGYFPFEVSGIEADPEGRYVLLVSPSESKVFRLDLVNYIGTPVPILDASAQPDLSFADDIYVCRFYDQIKTYVIHCTNGKEILLHDSQNDAIFETVDVMTDEAFYSSEYGNYAEIVEEYHNYDVVGLFQ